MSSDSHTARFIVSTDKSDTSPVDGATWERYVVTDVRTKDDPAKCGRPNDGAWWYSEGRNHRLIPARHKQGDDQWIARDKDAWAWIVDEHRAMVAMREAVSDRQLKQTACPHPHGAGLRRLLMEPRPAVTGQSVNGYLWPRSHRHVAHTHNGDR